MARSKNETAAYSLISQYINLYQEKYNSKPAINKYKEKWATMSLVEDFGMEDVKNTLNYYFITSKDRHPFNWFCNNFVNLYNSMNSYEKDKKIRRQQRIETQKLRQEYLNGIS